MYNEWTEDNSSQLSLSPCSTFSFVFDFTGENCKMHAELEDIIKKNLKSLFIMESNAKGDGNSRAQTFEVLLLQQWSCDSSIRHHIPENLQRLLLQAWLSSGTRSVKQNKGKRSVPTRKKATSPAFKTTMLTLYIDIHTNDYLIPVVQFQKCRLLWVFYLIPLILAFLLRYWQPPTEEYLLCRAPSNEIPIWPFYLMSVGLCTSNNTKYLSPANDSQ